MNDADGPPKPTDQGLLKAYLAERDVACPVCDYNLKNLDHQVCPECGSALQLQLGSTDLHVLPWIAAILASAVPAGFYLIVSLTTIYFWIMEGPPSDPEKSWILWFYGLTLLNVLTCTLLITLRRNFFRRKKDEQKMLAATIGVVCIGSVIVYMSAFMYTQWL